MPPMFEGEVDTSLIIFDDNDETEINPFKHFVGQRDVATFTFPPVLIPGFKRMVKVCLQDGISSISIKTLGRLELLEVAGDLITKIGDFKGGMVVKQNGDLIEMFDHAGALMASVSTVLRLKSMNQYNVIEVGKRSFRGSLIIRHGTDKSLIVINEVDIEDYLRGVLPYEMKANDKGIIEALKAQAVAARTYTMSHLNQFQSLGFDLYSDQRDQVYNGIRSETFITDKAVSETRGLLLYFQDELAKCYYHSTCGGKTANIHEVWGGKALPYLSARSDLDDNNVPYCKASSYRFWYESWNITQLTRIIRENLASANVKDIPAFNRITGMNILSHTASGRNKILMIQTDKGPINVYGDKIRWALRRSDDPRKILASISFDIKKFGPTILLEGRGFGHGIGMCQMGAMGRALRGQNFVEILYAYYDQTRIVRFD